VMPRFGELKAAIIGLAAASFTLLAYAFVTEGWQVYAFFVIGSLGALIYPALNGILTRRVDATRQGALQGGLGAMNSVAAVIGPLIAAQSLAWGSERGFDGTAFLISGVLMGLAGVIIAVAVPKLTASAKPTA